MHARIEFYLFFRDQLEFSQNPQGEELSKVRLFRVQHEKVKNRSSRANVQLCFSHGHSIIRVKGLLL